MGQDLGGTLLYKPENVFAALKGRVYGPFWWSENTAYFDLELGMVFEETTGAYMYECIYRFQFQMNKNEKEICEFEMNFKNFLFAL